VCENITISTPLQSTSFENKKINKKPFPHPQRVRVWICIQDHFLTDWLSGKTLILGHDVQLHISSFL
jgi:hypothetical protein